MDVVFTVQQILEKRREFNLPTVIRFVDYEKAKFKPRKVAANFEG